MAWETRQGTKGRYYYRATRVDGRVRKACLGNGPRATLAARQDADERANRGADQAAARALATSLEPLERLCIESDEQINLLVEAYLLAGGFHQHKGQWRRRHGRHSNPTAKQGRPRSEATPTGRRRVEA